MKTALIILALISLPVMAFTGLLLDTDSMFYPLTRFMFSLN